MDMSVCDSCCKPHMHVGFRKRKTRDFPGVSARTWGFHCKGLGSIPGWGTKICKSHSTALKKKKKKAKQKLSSIDCWMSSHYPVSFLLSKRKLESSKPEMSLAKGPHFDGSFAKCVANVI